MWKPIRIAVLGLLTFSIFLSCTSLAQSTFSINLNAVRESVVFLYFRDADGSLKEAGTGFLMAAHSRIVPNESYVFLVTARHIADPNWAHCAVTSGTLYAAFNTKPSGADSHGSTHEAPLPTNWSYPSDDSADVAVLILPPALLDVQNIENIPMDISEIPTQSEAEKIDTGAQITSAGLLLGASGTKRNYPIFKFGYVSSKPDETINVPCYQGGPARAMSEWMIAASLVPGNSGSPIYFVPVGFPGFGVSGQRSFLLGVQSSSFIGSDVAGMTPVRFLLDAIRRIGIPDMDLLRFDVDLKGPTVGPSSGHPQPNPVVVPVLPPA